MILIQRKNHCIVNNSIDFIKLQKTNKILKKYQLDDYGGTDRGRRNLEETCTTKVKNLSTLFKNKNTERIYRNPKQFMAGGSISSK